MVRGKVFISVLALGASLFDSAQARPPRLYATPDLQSPASAAGDELLLLAGDALSSDDRVVYRLDSELPADWPRGASIPAANDAAGGVAEVLAPASDSQALVVRLPRELDARTTYQLAVVNRAGEWSNAVRINDARASWLSPAEIPARGEFAAGGRVLKVVGRSLAGETRLRLRGPEELELAAEASTVQGLDEYMAQVTLPEALPAGSYAVAVSRDGRRWSEALSLRVTPEEPVAEVMAVDAARFGGCRADDTRDDTACVAAAIEAAAARGATVLFPAGTWRIDAPAAAGVQRGAGIFVPRGVSLRGVPDRSRIERSAAWQTPAPMPTFVLAGENTVEHLEFVDLDRQRGRGHGEFLQVGATWYRVASREPSARVVSDIRIVDNRFHGAEVAIRHGGLPLARLVIADNRFAAWGIALAFGGDANNLRDPFRIDDAIVVRNRFDPGSYVDAAIRQGTRAAEFGAGSRVDFSGNVADGSSVAGLDKPGDARGWRAAFFWHLSGPQEQLLIADNTISCSGDKAGDGEAIALDNNHNSAGFEWSRAVSGASSADVVVDGAPSSRAEGRAVEPAFFSNYWLHVDAGPGIGQSRRVSALRVEANGRTRFAVSPAWDVMPVPGQSRVSLARVFWQTLVIGNRIDQRSPCTRANPNGPKGGSIAVWAQTSDSVVAHNRQFDTDGIVFQQNYGAGGTSFNSFLDIRRNEIHGRYTRGREAGASGIRGSHGAALEGAPPVEGFGIRIAHNVIDGAEGLLDSAIGLPLTWHAGPPPHRWPLLDRPLIFGNRLGNARVGIDIPANAQVRGAVLYANRCVNVRTGVRVERARHTLLCAQDLDDACECPD